MPEKEAPEPSQVYRCSYCGQFYSKRTAYKHQICQRLEDKEAAGL